MDPRLQLVQNDNAGQKNSLTLFEQLLFDYSPRVGGMNNWGRKHDPYGTELPSYLPKPPGNDTRPGNVVPFQRTNMEGPSSGLLAGGVPLPPRRPPGIGSEGFDLPTGPGHDLDQLMREAIEEERQNDARRAERRAQRQTKGMAELGELKQDYPYGAGFPETSPSFPAPAGQTPMSRLNETLSMPSKPTAAEMGREWGASQDLPLEYQPDRTIPLGELQRRWGVPRLEDL